jgi:hypothetical protein
VPAIEAYRIIEEHCGRPKLPRKAAGAIRAILKERPDDPQVWLLAARCLRRSSPPWAYQCYQRAVRLRPEDLALAEEAGMFGLAAIGGRRDRRSSRFLVAARADPQRRERIDAVLRPYVRELIPAAAVFAVVGSVFGMLAGASVVRRGRGIYASLPAGVDPLPPIAGLATAVGVLLAVAGLYWGAMAPTRRFGREVLRQVLRWPPRPIHTLALALAVAGVVGGLVMAAVAGDLAVFGALGPWVALCYLLTLVVALLGVPARTSLAALIEVIKSAVTR